MLPVIPQAVNALIQDEQGGISTYPFPDNIAAVIPQQVRQQIFRWMLKNYIWPQVMERRPFEQVWDRMLAMAKAARKKIGKDIDPKSRLARKGKESDRGRNVGSTIDGDVTTISSRIEISDTLIFDTVDRLSNLNHFISFKDSLPIRYEIPEDVVFPDENAVYSPTSSLVKSANAWLKFNAGQADVYRKHWMTARHHYTYGISLVSSEYVQRIEEVPRRDPANKKIWKNMPELVEVGITFEPISIRKLWLNWRLPVYKMDYQVCPFFFEEMPRFAIVAKPYEPELNPFGFVNLDTIPKAQYLFVGQELSSYQHAFEESNPGCSLSQLTAPEFNIEMLWTFYPMLPLSYDETQAQTESGGFVFDEDGSLGIPAKRYIMQTFGNSLLNGQQEIIRLQRNFYPQDSLPIYGSAHMPTLDDGAYPEAIGSILENHYDQICTCLLQAIENKDWINDPPVKIQFASPAMDQDLNAKGTKIKVNSMADFEARTPYDATQTTPAMLEMIRTQAQSSSKVVDAILGKAMGSRTSATEASNIFQTAMSGVTTDVNLFTHDIMGGYATRVWDFTGRWVDPDVLQAITGSYGFRIKPEHLAIRLGLKWDAGSSFIESITRQQNIRYLLETTQPGDPDVNRAYLLRMLLKEWKFPDVQLIVNDGGAEQQVLMATTQTIETYLGKFVMIDPEQDHAIAIRVKNSFLKDRGSVWNSTPETASRGQMIVQQIMQHQQFLALEQQQQMLMQAQQQEEAVAAQALQSMQKSQSSQGRNPAPPSRVNTTAGAVAQEH
jgi:hypothetical protein